MAGKKQISPNQEDYIINSRLSVKLLAEIFNVSKHCIYEILNNRSTI